MVNWKYIVRYGPCSKATPLMFSNSFYFHHFSPYFRKIPMFDNYFQIGWNHHLALHLFSLRFNAAPTKNYAKCLHTHRQDLMMAGVAARREPFLFTLEGKPGTQFLLGNNWFQEGHLGNQIYCIYIYTHIDCVHIFAWIRIVSSHLLDILKKATNQQFTIDLDLSGTCNAFSFNSGSVFSELRVGRESRIIH